MKILNSFSGNEKLAEAGLGWAFLVFINEDFITICVSGAVVMVVVTVVLCSGGDENGNEYLTGKKKKTKKDTR